MSEDKKNIENLPASDKEVKDTGRGSDSTRAVPPDDDLRSRAALPPDDDLHKSPPPTDS